MLTAAQETALYAWLNGQTGLAVSWADQKAPELPYPFAQLKVIAGPTRVGSSDSKSSELVEGTGSDPDTLTLITKGPRLHTVSIDVYASSDTGGANAQYYVSKAMDGLQKDSVHVALLAAGIAIVEPLEPVDLDETVNIQWVSRCKFDLRIRTNSTVEETGAAYIDKANITGTIGDHAVAVSVNKQTFMSSHGELVLDTPTTVSAPVAGTYVPVDGVFSASNLKDFELDGTNGLKYTGAESKGILVIIAGSGEATVATKVFLKLAIDGTLDENSYQWLKFSTVDDADNFSLLAIVDMSTNQVLTLHVTGKAALAFTINTMVATAIAA